MTIRAAFRMVTPPTWTGGLNYLLNICRVLRAHEHDIEPVFFAPPGLDSAVVQSIVEATGVPPYSLRERTRRDDALAIMGRTDDASAAAFIAAKIDVLFESTGYYGPRPPLPVVSWIPDFQHRRLPRMFSPSQWLIRELRYRKILATRRHLVLSSEDARADMLQFFGEPRGTVHVAPFAVRLESVPSFTDGERVRLAHGLPERFIFLPNQFWPHKNHAIVVEALGLMGREAPCIVASGTGERQLQDRLKKRLSSLGASDRFRIVGHLRYADILGLMVRCDAVLNPSLFEGWSTTVEEAKALGTPLLLSNLSVHREQVGTNGVFFDPHDARDCAGALQVAVSLPPRKPADNSIAATRNGESQRIFASRLRTAFMAAMEDAASYREI
jgi:glycosyltransferase involved in cell wall biosynthesis